MNHCEPDGSGCSCRFQIEFSTCIRAPACGEWSAFSECLQTCSAKCFRVPHFPDSSDSSCDPFVLSSQKRLLARAPVGCCCGGFIASRMCTRSTRAHTELCFFCACCVWVQKEVVQRAKRKKRIRFHVQHAPPHAILTLIGRPA